MQIKKWIFLSRKASFADHHQLHRQPSHRRHRSSSPPKKHHHHHHTGPEFHQNFHDWQRAGHRAIFGGTGNMDRRRFSSHHHHHHQPVFRPNYYSESDYTDFVPLPQTHQQQWPRYRHRSSPVQQLRNDKLDFGVFSAHDLHAANERRASRRDLADMRDQLFVRSSSHNNLAPPPRVGRDLLTNWERQHCQTCNKHTLKRHSVSHHHLI